MDNNQGMIGMALGSWLVALAGGVLAAVLLWVLGGWSFMQGAFAGFVIFVVFGALISWIMTRPLPAPGELNARAAAGDAPEPAKRAETPAPAPVAAAAPAATETPAAAAPKPAAAKTTAKKPAAKKPAAKKAAPKKAAAAKEAGEVSRPAAFSDAPRAGGADDLKRINGVGPKLEETLNSLGIWHFDQVASLTKTDIAWVDERLRFKGRIERDDWVGQAKELAKGD
ncbi:hypothetical protein KX928_08920 [Roseobacter sp. YSTF-M11]|uniref:50S ribosomal protein L21 n=1 Tax=Roseobacter insulae TaxID=2859783 RepID=A0A9X1FUP6_9RHOB|nr:hypothetical protein [Roseobacter insulae]MBW4707906.1 hypothetical protein [Roseobacter insulae]